MTILRRELSMAGKIFIQKNPEFPPREEPVFAEPRGAQSVAVALSPQEVSADC